MQHDHNGGKCGICGDPWDDFPRWIDGDDVDDDDDGNDDGDDDAESGICGDPRDAFSG